MNVLVNIIWNVKKIHSTNLFRLLVMKIQVKIETKWQQIYFVEQTKRVNTPKLLLIWVIHNFVSTLSNFPWWTLPNVLRMLSKLHTRKLASDAFSVKGCLWFIKISWTTSQYRRSAYTFICVSATAYVYLKIHSDEDQESTNISFSLKLLEIQSGSWNSGTQRSPGSTNQD